MLRSTSLQAQRLVDHPTGSGKAGKVFVSWHALTCTLPFAGKTREMIKVLDNYYLDPRPKVPIFPKASQPISLSHTHTHTRIYIHIYIYIYSYTYIIHVLSQNPPCCAAPRSQCAAISIWSCSGGRAGA